MNAQEIAQYIGEISLAGSIKVDQTTGTFTFDYYDELLSSGAIYNRPTLKSNIEDLEFLIKHHDGEGMLHGLMGDAEIVG